MNVWAVISVGENISRGRDPASPLSGGPMSIFAPAVTRIETVIECVGVYTNPEAAQACAARHIAKHANHRVKIRVLPLDAADMPAADDTPVGCSDCGRPVSGGVSRCGPCTQAFWLACRESDPELLEELAAAVKR